MRVIQRRLHRQRMHRQKIIILMSLPILFGLLWTIYTLQAPDKSLVGIRQIKHLSTMPVAPSGSAPFVVVLDAGHGGHDPGADGVSGIYEKDLTQAITNKVYQLLLKEPAFTPYMTRTEDIFIELEERAAIANSLKAHAFLSIHGNTFSSDPDVTGTETYYYDSGSTTLAQALQQAIVDRIGSKNRGIKQEEWTVLLNSEVPAALLEIGFLTNPKEEAFLLGAKGQNQVAQAIVDGLKSYFKIE